MTKTGNARTQLPPGPIAHRRRLIAALMSACLWIAGLHQLTGSEIVLDGRTDVEILESGPFGSASGILSDLLQRYLLMVLDKSELAGPGSKVTITLEAKAADWHELPPREIKDIADADAFEIAISASPQPSITIVGQTPLATGFGVMFFLEKHLGVFWAFPGELGLCLPAERTFRLNEGRERFSPWVVARGMSGLDLRDGRVDLVRSSEMTGVLRDHRAFFLVSDYFKSLRLHRGTVHHNMIKIFPVDECRAQYPEVFPMQDDGTRFIPPSPVPKSEGGGKPFQAWHPCYTSPKTLEVAVAKGWQALAEGELFYSLGINDGRKVQCQCAPCREAGWPQSYYQFVNRVADALKDRYPPQMVGVLAYGDVGIPPRDLKLRENVLVNVAGMRKDVWESLAPALGSYEYIYGAGYVIPNLPLDVIQENFRYYRARNLRMYRAEFYPVWAFDAPKAYVVSRLLWDPGQDVYRLLRTYCDRVFGTAGEPMYRYYAHVASIRKGDVQPGRFTPVWNREWPFREPLQCFRCPEDLHERLSACLAEAKGKELTPQERARVAMVEAFTEFSTVYYQMHRLKETVFAGQAEPATAIQQAEQLKLRRKEVFAVLNNHPEWFAGTSSKVDQLLERPWPTRRLENELEAALATAKLQWKERRETSETAGRSAVVGQAAPCRFLPLRRNEHPSYKPTQHVPIKAIPAPHNRGFTFQTSPNVAIQEFEDPRHQGKNKAQWLHATARDLPLDEGCVYVLTAELDGRDGLLELELQGNARTGDRRKHEFCRSIVEFAAGGERAVRRVVIDPSACLPDDGGEARLDARMSLQLQLLWRPDGNASELQGEVRLERVHATFE